MKVDDEYGVNKQYEITAFDRCLPLFSGAILLWIANLANLRFYSEKCGI